MTGATSTGFGLALLDRATPRHDNELAPLSRPRARRVLRFPRFVPRGGEQVIHWRLVACSQVLGDREGYSPDESEFGQLWELLWSNERIALWRLRPFLLALWRLRPSLLDKHFSRLARVQLHVRSRQKSRTPQGTSERPHDV